LEGVEMKKRMIRKRFNPVRFFRGIGLVIILAVTMTFFIKGSATGTLQTDYKQITVKRGDTIWEIARDNKDGGTEIEEVIYAIKKANKINNSGIYPGQVIKIPLSY
jgi:hypothetical protein